MGSLNFQFDSLVKQYKFQPIKLRNKLILFHQSKFRISLRVQVTHIKNIGNQIDTL